MVNALWHGTGNAISYWHASASMLRRLKPQIVISMDPGNWSFDSFYHYHPDHRATALAVFDAIYPAAGTSTYTPQPDAGLPPHKVQEVYFTGSAHPNTYVDITDSLELKIRALISHRSQIKDSQGFARYVRDMAARNGAQNDCQYAECFRRLEVPQ